MRLALAPRAKSDLKEIWNYIFQESQDEAIASRLIEKLLRTIGRLKNRLASVEAGRTTWGQTCAPSPVEVM